MANPHRLIRKHMQAVARGDNMPVGLGKGSRLKLADVWGELGYRQVAEIGVRAGDFSRELLRRIPKCRLFCIDLWHEYPLGRQTEKMQEDYYLQAQSRLAVFGERVMFLRLTSQEALGSFKDNELDAVFIDGNHAFDYACPDIIFWSQKVRSGGMIAVHDYCPMRHSGVMQAVDAYTHCHSIRPWYVTRESLPTAFWVKP